VGVGKQAEQKRHAQDRSRGADHRETLREQGKAILYLPERAQRPITRKLV
jgi:hypothetical protein